MKSIRYFAQGFKLCFHRSILPWVALPVALTAVTYVVLFVYFWQLASQSVEQLDLEDIWWLPGFIAQGIEYVLFAVVSVIFYLLLQYLFINTAILIMSPFYDIIISKAHSVLNKTHVGVLPSRFVLSLLNSLKRQIYLLWHQLKWVVFLLVLSLIPLMNSLAAPGWILLSAWILIFSTMDMVFEHNSQSVKATRSFLTEQKSNTFTLGFCGYLFSLVPVLNLLTIPTILLGCTLWVHENQAVKSD